MERRFFLKAMASGATALGTGASTIFPASAMAACPLPKIPRTLVNVMLNGGADMRFLFVPSPNQADLEAYTEAFWTARRRLYTSNSSTSYSEIFELEYDEVEDPASGQKFGIHKSSSWLRDQFNQGNLAIIANSFGSRNLRHDQSQLNVKVGEPGFEELIYDRDGWGGRLLESIADNRQNVIELNHEISVFCNGTIAGERLQQVVHAQNMRDIALQALQTPSSNPTDPQNISMRALDAYYKARGTETALEKPSDWPYHLFFQHHSALEVGDLVTAQLDACGPHPTSLQELNLYKNDFRLQCRNLYDTCLVADVIGERVISMSSEGWDMHYDLNRRISRNLQDLFGPIGTGGLSTVTDELSLLSNNANSNMVYVFATEFGRQLAANGDEGTDHGRGNATIIAGESVNGGIYGELFPLSEITPVNGIIPYEKEGADITGLTSVERIFSQVCDWIESGTGTQVFPNANSSDLEPGVDLSELFI